MIRFNGDPARCRDANGRFVSLCNDSAGYTHFGRLVDFGPGVHVPARGRFTVVLSEGRTMRCAFEGTSLPHVGRIIGPLTRRVTSSAKGG